MPWSHTKHNKHKTAHGYLIGWNLFVQIIQWALMNNECIVEITISLWMIYELKYGLNVSDNLIFYKSLNHLLH